MASLQLSTLKIRTLSAIVYVIVFLGSLLFHPLLFLLFCLIVHAGCWKEYLHICLKVNQLLKRNSQFHNYGVVFAGTSLILLLTQNSFAVFSITFGEIGWWLLLISVFILPIIDVLFSNDFFTAKIYADLFGFFYLSLSLALLVQIRIDPFSQFANHGLDFVVVMIITIWLNDSLAYLGGSLFGKTPFFPKISPKKTWEGTIIGIVFSISSVTLIAYYFFFPLLITFILIACISSIIGTIGDLVESKLKRMAGIKDSGKMMPGHGGFLDRFDSILLATPFVWLGLLIYFLVQ